MRKKTKSTNEEITLQSTPLQNYIFVFFKGVKEKTVKHSIIERNPDTEKIIEVISKLPTGSQKKFDEINLNTNPKLWIKKLLENGSTPDKEKTESLINDFTDSMKTRMREEEKYVIGILRKGELLLSHTYFGEETITPEWKVIPRMLDLDNVIRYVMFIKESNGDISVKYYEKYSTDSFVDWLGLPQKDALYHFGGKYRISTEMDGIVNTLEIPIEKIDSWISNHDEIKKSEIVLQTPLKKLKIVQIRVGRKKYDKPGDFLQDFYAEKYNIDYYRKRFDEILNSMKPYSHKYIDEKGKVIMIEGDTSISVVEKTNPNFDILFCCNLISIRESYLDDLYRRFSNGETINIYHAGHSFSHQPLTIKKLNIWNVITTPAVFSCLDDYLKNIDLSDKIITQLLEVILIYLLKSGNGNKHISVFLNDLCNKILENIKIGSKIAKLEDGVIEFKSRDYFTGKDKEIIEKLSNDLKKKLSSNPTKVYLIGVNDDGSLDPIPNNRLASDRINSLQGKIKEASRSDTLIMMPVKSQKNTSIMILIGGRN